MNLFDLDREITACIKLENSDDYVSLETGEIIDLDALNALKMERDRKVRNIACWIKNLESDEKALAEQIKVFQARKKAAENKRESLKGYLAAFLGGKKWENAEVKIGWRESDVVNITCDVKNLPELYLKYAPPEPNKLLLKADIKAGKTILGAEIVKKRSILIR